jgi:predicted membrane-bound spermidine synthase
LSKQKNTFKPIQLYCISFIEGGVVMVTEIAGAKLLTPFFGASLYSWASTLSITLLALMCGYYYGGYVTTKSKFRSPGNIVLVFLLSGISVFLMPSIASFIMHKTISMSFFTGLITSELCFIFIPIFLMGMISPMIIFQITERAEQSGRSSGNIYAISTSGGILFTFIFGFMIIPQYGISVPLKILGITVCALGLIFLFKNKLYLKARPVMTVVLFFCAISAFKQTNSLSGTKKQLVTFSEGLLGELKIEDEMIRSSKGEPAMVRKLRTNNIQQNYVFVDLPTQSLMYYVNFTKHLINTFPEKGSSLLIGLGAGSIYNLLADKCKEVETVEIDQRIYDYGVRYFGMPAHKDHHITDGRYFINTSKKKYDLIVLDVIIGESVPGQLVTVESFKRCYDLLNTNGTLLIEHGGVKGFGNNSFIPSIVRTLKAAGFQVSIFNPLKSKDFGDILFVASKYTFNYGDFYIPADVLVTPGVLSDYYLPYNTFKTQDAKILTDDQNESDILLKEHYFTIRNSIRKEIAEGKL